MISILPLSAPTTFILSSKTYSAIVPSGTATFLPSNSVALANATELEGKKVAVPLGTMAEYVFDESMKVVGADRGKMDIIQMDPEEGAAALVSGDVVMACHYNITTY